MGKNMAQPKKGKPKVKTTRAPSPVTTNRMGVKFSRLKGITIETGKLVRLNVTLNDKPYSIEFTESWIELLQLLFGMVYEKNTTKFMSILADYNVLSNGIMVHKEVVSYPNTENVKYELYKLKNSPYYIEFRTTGNSYIKAIGGLLKAVGIELKNVSFDIVPSTTEHQTQPKQTISNSSTLTELINAGKYEIRVTGLGIFGYEQPVKSTIQALIIFMTWANETYGEKLQQAGLSEAQDGVGLTTVSKIDEYGEGFTTYKLGNNYLYSCEDNYSILNYIYKVAVRLDFNTDLIIIQYNERGK